MVLGKLPVPGGGGILLIWIIVGKGLLHSRGGLGLFGHFFSHLSFLSSFDGPI